MAEPDMDVYFVDRGREPRCPPDPKYPEGMVVVDCAEEDRHCNVGLPYPAPRCGLWIVLCHTCGKSCAITAAGRVDDPRVLIMGCKDADRQDVRMQ